MQHLMNLSNSPFQSIKNGNKTIEMRLFDKKRQSIKVDDVIVFTNLSTSEVLKVKVLKISVYKNFEELYSHHDKSALGYINNEVANPEDMLRYYSKEDINKYGTVAIGVKVI